MKPTGTTGEESCKERHGTRGSIFEATCISRRKEKSHFPETALPDLNIVRQKLFAEESSLVASLAQKARLASPDTQRVKEIARRLVEDVRRHRSSQGGIDAFMHEYSLSSEEGVVLMCLAEALLRIPDAETADKLIADKLGGKDWQKHVGHSESLFVNASAWGLMLTGRFVELGRQTKEDITGYLAKLMKRSGEPVVRQAMRQAMRIMGKQFVLGRTISEALKIAKPLEEQGYRFSYDMLGEAAMTMADADRYLAAYETSLKEVASAAKGTPSNGVFARPSISVKLSALHPRYEEKARQRVLTELKGRVLKLAQQAKASDLGLTIDAEESYRLELSLELLEALLREKSIEEWNGLGLAVQAYGKRAYPLLEWLAEGARDRGRMMPVRLVKGAYWDTEIKRAQEGGFEAYPVFTRKVSTDVSYLACAKYMLGQRDVFYPQFATHNAHTLAAVHVMAGNDKRYEFQRLHGMGQQLYANVISQEGLNQPARIYAPVGSHEDLLAYLVRRLLENGANTSFVNRLADDNAPIAEIVTDPVDEIKTLKTVPHPRIPLPRQIFSPRRNSEGVPLWDSSTRMHLTAEIEKVLQRSDFSASPLVNGETLNGTRPSQITSPHDRRVVVGQVAEAEGRDIETALASAVSAFRDWDRLGGQRRAEFLEKAADLYEANRPLLMALLVREAGKTLDNAQADLREAVDFLRYYAMQAREQFADPRILPGPTGERNELSLHGRGVFAAIAPWNFPLAIYTGQMAAALAAGNAVLAKPAEQTPLIGVEAVKLLHLAGVPQEVLHFLPGEGARIGGALIGDLRLSGIAFTGSNETATIINRSLAQRHGAIIPFIAETGGLNAMIVDSSALPEQAVRDVVSSAFDSAGQRCSAARILFVQDDAAQRVLPMLKGAIAELKLGDPLDYATDVGPVIDEEARSNLESHKEKMRKAAKTLFELPLGPEHTPGTFVAPAAFELPDLSLLRREVFGPILHVVRFSGDRLAEVCDEINATGYGLTLGLHTRIESTVEEVRARIKVGNMYVNRNQIGAVVGSQPFGGEGLSGTGPKAGGPHYLHRFATERVLSVDTTASGGNAALMSMEAES
jgi:RHH-type transcriptional regulator, proline utilization regulon repressor / proline dehydrogenase / delta 1-pyrroline-5-carboxylate dehydrogenase